MNNKIKLYGDFVAPNVSKLKISNKLNRVISESNFNILNFEIFSMNGAFLNRAFNK